MKCGQCDYIDSIDENVGICYVSPPMAIDVNTWARPMVYIDDKACRFFSNFGDVFFDKKAEPSEVDNV